MKINSVLYEVNVFGTIVTVRNLYNYMYKNNTK